MKYRERNRKLLQLPSGAKIVIAKLNYYNEPFIVDHKGDNTARGVRLAKFALTNPSNGLLEFEGESARIVDKSAAEAGEITIGDIDQADAEEIVNSVLEFSGLTKAGQEARKTFPEGQDPSGQPASTGQALQPTPDRPVEAAAG